MGTMSRLCFVLMVLSLAALVSSFPDHHTKDTHHNTRNQLLYILMDGFRWDYVDRQPASSLPGFTRFLQEGVRARWTIPIFPTLSFPSWTTLVTGLYAESHGVVGNYFYDPEDKDVFSQYDPESMGKQKWWTAEKVWTTAEKAELRTALFTWERCDVPIDGVTPTFCSRVTDKPTKQNFQRYIDRALDKLSQGFSYVQIYAEHTDYAGHKKGADSPELTQAVKALDDGVLHLLEQLRHRNLEDQVNIVIASDHGMTSVAPGDVTLHELDDFLDASLVEKVVDYGAFVNIKVQQQNVDKVYEQLSKIPGVKAYRREDVPQHYHYQHHKYIHEIILIAEKGHFILPSRSTKQVPAREEASLSDKGSHGYRPEEEDMRGIFFAKGPAFKCGWTLDPIHMVDIYQVMTHTLAITPQPHNGTWAHVQGALAQDEGRDGCTRTSAAASSPTPGLSLFDLTAVLSSLLFCPI